jgi:hypothetical protein
MGSNPASAGSLSRANAQRWQSHPFRQHPPTLRSLSSSQLPRAEQPGFEWSDLGSRDIDGQAERPTERERRSQRSWSLAPPGARASYPSCFAAYPCGSPPHVFDWRGALRAWVQSRLRGIILQSQRAALAITTHPRLGHLRSGPKSYGFAELGMALTQHIRPIQAFRITLRIFTIFAPRVPRRTIRNIDPDLRRRRFPKGGPNVIALSNGPS